MTFGVKTESWINTLLAISFAFPFIAVFIPACVVDCATALRYRRRSDEEVLLEYLFRDYNPSARPVLNSSQTVSVNVQFSLLQIQELVCMPAQDHS